MIRRGGLGDTLLTAPLLRALRRAHAGAHLHLAGTREYCDVLCAYGACDVVLSAEDLWLWMPDRARDVLAAFDLVVSDEPGVGQVALRVTEVGAATPFGLQLARRAGLEPRWPDDSWLLPPAADQRGPRVLAVGSGGAS